MLGGDLHQAQPRGGHGQAPPGERLPEGGGALQERGDEVGPNGAVDRALEDHRSGSLPRWWPRAGWPLRRLSATPRCPYSPECMEEEFSEVRKESCKKYCN